MRIFVQMTDCPPRQQSNSQWRAPSAAPQAAMLLTLSNCLLTKQPRPETDAIGHRSPFCEQFLTEWAFTTKRSQRSLYVSIIQAHMLQHIFPAASVRTNEGRWVAQRLNDSGSYCLPHAQILASLCGLNFREHFSLPITLSVFEGILFRYDDSMMPGVFLNICMQHLC